MQSSKNVRKTVFAEWISLEIEVKSLSGSAVNRTSFKQQFVKEYPHFEIFYDGLLDQWMSSNPGRLAINKKTQKIVFNRRKEAPRSFLLRNNRNQKKAQKKMITESKKDYKERRENFFVSSWNEDKSIKTMAIGSSSMDNRSNRKTS